ncbi:hypothetical protein GA0116948_1267, partial [Chitinophaga costaii]
MKFMRLTYLQMKKIALLLLPLLFAAGSALAAIEPYRQVLQGHIKKGDTLLVKDEKFQNSAIDWTSISNRSVTNVVTFSLWRDTLMVLTKKFTVNVDLKVEYWSRPDQQDPVVVAHVPLKISYDTATGAVYAPQDIYQFMNGYKVKLTVNDIKSPELGDALPGIFLLSSQVIVDRSYTTPQGGNKTAALLKTAAAQLTSGNLAQVTLNQLDTTSAQVNVLFPTDNTAEEYDLEWTYVDEESDPGRQLAVNGTATADAALAVMFRNNATRVTLGNAASYNINVISYDAYLLLRIRRVSYTSGFRNEQPWQYQMTLWNATQTTSTTSQAVVLLSAPWHQPRLNWQYSASFAEEGKKKEVISYLDGSLRNRQAVTLNNSDNIAVVQENVYDRFGRSVANILPAPINKQALEYYRSLNLSNTGTNIPYSYKDVDPQQDGACIPLPQPLKNTVGAAAYYSANNEFAANATLVAARPFLKYIPDAAGYPLAVTAYTADNTGRVSVQGGVGLPLQPNNTDGGHATRYYYGKPLAWEIDRLFGNDVGNTSHYLKNMVQDANGQLSISYQNMEGKTIATALAGETPTSLSPLDSKPGANLMNVTVLQPGDFQFDPSTLSITGSATYLANTTGNAAFTYTADKLIEKYVQNGVIICSNCYYDLHITITDDCGNDLMQSSDKLVQIGSTVSDCNATGKYNGNFNVNFGKIGEFYITFKLSYNPDVIEAFANDFVARNTNLKTRYQFIQDQLDQSNFMDCYSDCTTCKASLGDKPTFVNGLYARFVADSGKTVAGDSITFNNWANKLYDSLYAKCQASMANCQSNACDELRQQMAGDVSPGGQYALFDSSYQPLEKDINVIFQHWRDVFPVKHVGDSLYSATTITLADNTTTSPCDTTFTLAMLVQYWEPEWGLKFVQYHPEQCGLSFCNTYGSYLSWDKQIQEVYTKASDIPLFFHGAGYQYVSSWLMTADPFFASGALGSGYSSQFASDLANYSRDVMGVTNTDLSVKGLSQYVDYELYCADTTASIQTNAASHPTELEAWNSCTPATACRIIDREWGLYSQLYFELKKKYYSLARQAYCGSMCAIGTEPPMTGTSCPSPLNFTIVASSKADSAGFKFAKVISVRDPVGKNAVVTLNYPPEYNGLNATTTLNFTPLDDSLNFYYDARIDINLISIGEVTCICDNATILRVESQTSTNTYYGGGYNYGIDVMPCNNANVIPAHGCVKVYVGSNPNPQTFTDVNNIWKCATCDGTTSTFNVNAVYQWSDTSFSSADSLYIIRPNSTQGFIYPIPTSCQVAPRYYNCMSVNYNGNLSYFAHAYVYACRANISSRVAASATAPQSQTMSTAGDISAAAITTPVAECNYANNFSLVPVTAGHPLIDTFYVRYTPGAHPIPYSTTVTITIACITFVNNHQVPQHIITKTYPADFDLFTGKSSVYVKSNYGPGEYSDAENYIQSVTCVTPGCSPLYANKVSRLDDYTTPSFPNNKDSLRNVTLSAIADQIHTNCENTADAWMQLLDSCMTTSLGTTYTTKRALLRSTLIDICSKGGDSSHAYGSSTTAPGLTGTGGYTSFRDAIKGILGMSAYQMLCNPWLLDNPYPYNTPVQAGMPQIGATNAAVCARITALQSDYAAASPHPATFYDYLRTHYAASMTLTTAQVNSLVNSCSNCRYLLDQVITLPVFMDPNNVGCLNVTQFNAGLAAFAAEGWTGLDTTKTIYSTILTNYLNQRWGFTLGEADYAAFRQAIYAAPSSTSLLLCNQPVYASIPQDPLDCAKGLIDNAVSEGLRQYDYYIDTVKQHFRTRYVNTCSAAQVQANMQVKEQIYHYTLYYYDQAGNLVRTVPPEGVDLLDGARLSQVQLARTQPTTCTYNGPTANTDQNTALSQLNTALTGTSKAIEMWLYNPNNTTSQLITATGSNQFLLVTCLDGRYMHLDLYPMSQSVATELEMNSTSAHIAVDMNAVLPLKQWTHLVLQGSNIASGTMSVYVNGVSCPLVTNAPNGTCSFEITAQAASVQVTQDLSMLKHLRFYNRIMTAAEILADAQDPCLGITGSLTSVLQLWSRFNVPSPNTSTTLADGSTTETQRSQVFPQHRITSNYAFNAMTQAIQQQTPDGGVSKFWYDKLGRIVASQNAQQASQGNVYSYTLYDVLSRITEVGQKTGVSPALPAPDFLTDATISTFAASGSKEQITSSFYDQPYAGSLTLGSTQANLRKRVSYSKYSDLLTTTDDQSAISFYTYDPLGNVSTLWQQVPGLGLRQTDYQFDLVSGKVNKVRYQFGKPDQFYYQYDYDAENRLTDVSSSVANLSATAPWELLNAKQDAHYQYYYHGPLGRELIGGSRGLQGIDYAYTLQGWLKGVNGNTANGTQDIGGDGITGSPSSTIARDAISFSLNYFDNDYQAINSAATALGLSYQHQTGDVGGQALFNGNISSSTLAYSNLTSGTPVGYAYHYDQLNRLLHMQQHVLSGAGTTWSAAQAVKAYEEQIKYDGNGNIVFFNRNGSHATTANVVESQADMDRLSYIYPKDNNGQLTANRLR